MEGQPDKSQEFTGGDSSPKRRNDYSPEVLRSSTEIIRAFKNDKSASQVGKVERGKNRMLVEQFLLENRRIIGNQKYKSIIGIPEEADGMKKAKIPRHGSYETLATY